MQDIRDVVAKNLKRLRAEKHINQEALAEKIGVSKETIAKTEIRQNWLGAENFNKIIEYFEIEPYELFISKDLQNEQGFKSTQLQKIKEELRAELSSYIDLKLKR